MLDFAKCSAALQRTTTVNPARIQGGLCGRLCGGSTITSGELLPFVAGATGTADADLRPIEDVIQDIYVDTHHQLQDQNGLVDLLLPNDDDPLPIRVIALSGWCSSYLSGLGQSGLSGATTLAPEVSEAMRDLAAIALADPQSGDDEGGEASYAELVEFVRVAVALIHVEISAMMSPNSTLRH